MLEDFKLVISKLDEVDAKYEDLNKQLSDPAVINNQDQFRELSKELSSIEEIAYGYKDLKKVLREYNDSKEILETEKDPEMKEMAQEELDTLTNTIEKMKVKLKSLLLPPDPMAGRNIIVEIRAGTGGEEAALFAAELYKLYARFAELNKWQVDIVDYNETGIGGYKEIVFTVSGKNVYENLRFESGGHRVQRIPATESGGRVHTSAVTVAIMPEAEEADIHINNEDLRIDVMRASGAGGQHVNKTESAVRITHIPTNTVVYCQDSRSQIKNKAAAMKILRSKLYEKQQAELDKERSNLRKGQVGSGDRSEKVRTYNFPQNRVTDHRINMTLYKLDQFMMGNISEMTEALKINFREEQLADFFN